MLSKSAPAFPGSGAAQDYDRGLNPFGNSKVANGGSGRPSPPRVPDRTEVCFRHTARAGANTSAQQLGNRWVHVGNGIVVASPALADDLGLAQCVVDGVVLSWVDYHDELRRWITEVMPLLEQAGLRSPGRDSGRSSDHGETAGANPISDFQLCA